MTAAIHLSTKAQETTTSYHPSLAGLLMAYISEFDGIKKDFSTDIEQQFRNIYHEDYINKSNDGKSPRNRDELQKLHEELLHLGARVSVEQFGFIAANCFLFTCHVVCEGNSIVIHNLVAVKDNKIVRSQVAGDKDNMEIYRNIH